MGNFNLPREQESQKKAVVKTYRDGTDFSVPTVDISGAALMLTNTLLAASGTYTQATQDRLYEIVASRVKGYVHASHTGTLTIEESDDGAAWTTSSTHNVSAKTLLDTGWINLTKRYFRFKFVNSATAQTSFTLHQALSAGSNDLQLTGSNVQDVTLQNAATAAGNGTPFVVEGFKTLTIEIIGTSTSRTIFFEAASVSNISLPIQGVKLLDMSVGSSTTGNNELWQFDVTGLVSFRARLSSVAGGNVSIKGKAVA